MPNASLFFIQERLMSLSQKKVIKPAKRLLSSKFSYFQSLLNTVMNKYFSTAILSALIFASCQSNTGTPKPDNNYQLQPTATTPVTMPVQTTDTLPVSNTSLQIPGVQTNQQTSAPATGNAGLNPAHGQPGHRCDIPEGTPLNSAPANSTQIPVTAQPNNSIILPKSQEGANVKLNPAHGQPGHDCAIPVGQPLKS